MKKRLSIVLALLLLLPTTIFARDIGSFHRRLTVVIHEIIVDIRTEIESERTRLDEERLKAEEKRQEEIRQKAMKAAAIEENSAAPASAEGGTPVGETGMLYGSEGPIIALDPGHQARGNSNLEPVAPWSNEQKPMVSSGTAGVATGIPEYVLNLQVAEKTRDELLARGYRVLMTRTVHEVNMSNVTRSKMVNESGAAAYLRIHADSAGSSAHGVMTISPGNNHPRYSESYKLSQDVLDAVTARTGAPARNLWVTDTMSGSNWSEVPVTIIEMGVMSNPTEDQKLATDDYQWLLAKGIADGIDKFFQ